MIAAQPLLKKYFPQPVTPSQQSQPAQTPPANPGTTAAATTAPSTPAVAVTKQASSETDTVIENDLYRSTVTSRDAQVKPWILKKGYSDSQNGPLDLVN